jgi:hypothetical protein
MVSIEGSRELDTLFSSTMMYWVGMDVPSDDPEDLREFNDFYSEVHAKEVLASNPGFIRGHRYELMTPDPRGEFGPRFLAVYEMSDEGAAQTYLGRADGPPEGRPHYTAGPPAWDDKKTTWRMIYRPIATTGSPSAAAYSIHLIGINPPADVDADGLKEFNDFYTDVHMPEVVAKYGYSRASRYELYRELLHPAPGCPRYLALYEADEETAARVKKGTFDSKGDGDDHISPGPDVWQRHTTPWRLTYRRLPNP